MRDNPYMPKQIQVTHKHIEEGEPGHARFCAVALAFDEAGIGITDVRAGIDAIRFQTSEKQEWKILTNEDLRTYIEDFDCEHSDVYPIQINIDYPEKCSSLGKVTFIEETI